MSDDGQAGQREGQDATRVILVADDNQRYRAGIVRAMARRPEIIRVVEAGDGAAALEMIREYRPEAALLDVRMPGLDGPSVVQAIRGDPSIGDVRVVVMSAAVDAAIREAVESAGATAFVDKATSRAEICAVVLGSESRPLH